MHLSDAEMLFLPEFLPTLAHAYSAILSVIQSQRSDRVRTQAISSIDALINLKTAIKKNESNIQVMAASSLSKMLPGFSQAVVSAIIKHKGRSSALKSVQKNLILITLEIFLCLLQTHHILPW